MRMHELLKMRIVAIVVTILMTACATSPKEKGVRVGMTQSDVLEIAGKPTETKKFSCPAYAQNCIEIWRYDGYQVGF